MPATLIGRLDIVVDYENPGITRGLGGYSFLVHYGEVTLQLLQRKKSYRWQTTVGFTEQLNYGLLGHTGFFDYFTATFNGLRRHVTLTSNRSLPSV